MNIEFSKVLHSYRGLPRSNVVHLSLFLAGFSTVCTQTQLYSGIWMHLYIKQVCFLGDRRSIFGRIFFTPEAV